MVYMTLSEREIIATLRNTESKALLALDVALGRVETVQNEIDIPVIVLSVADSMPALMKAGYILKGKPHKHSFMRWKDFLKHSDGLSTPLVAVDHEAPAIIVYTSGTTGTAKGVVLNSDAFNAISAQVKLSGKDYHRSETYLDMVPSFLGFGITMLQLSLCQGLDITLWIEINFDKVAKEFARLKPNRFISGPPLVDPIMKYTHGDMSWMIDFSGGGEAISFEKESQINDFLREHGSDARYTTAYGMSEFGSCVCVEQNHIYKQGSVGIPLQKVNISLIAIKIPRKINKFQGSYREYAPI